ncbi:MAG: DUF1592 domain-containing protein, partial [Gammaproteobacteria bacterium]|nr:DUF1592 domain-containing protein [Gammaproteobacteria bacterium]
MSNKKMNIRISILTKLICIALVFGLIPTRVLAAENSADEQITFVRLTSDQYRNAIRDIFGESIQVSGNAASTGVREAGLMAVGGRRLTLSAAEVETYEVLALDIASQVLSPSRRATLIPCQPRDESAADNTCASTFIESVGLHLFRRPLSKPEIETYAAMAATATESLGDFYAGLQSALVGMMVAPDFLFRIERSVSNPEQPGMRRLDAWSRASRLSFFLWDTTPNPALLEAARNGDLLFEDGLIQQVDQMMGSARIEDGLRAFFADMLAFDRFDTLDIDTNLFPKFTKNVEDEAREQTLRTISHHLLNNNADYR